MAPTEEELVKETVKKRGKPKQKGQQEGKGKLMTLHILPVFLLWRPTKEKPVRENVGLGSRWISGL